ncbi:MAG: zinc ribbon domain-containing protein [Treponema sp.]|jgi:putative FmdB family regulatory protein|nr:zinc ribbon domain-containing protein [Treponema sp.]
MPTYEYECRSCGYSFDVFQNMSDEPLKNCPQCGKEVRRVINGGTGVIFKGSGFYVTDKKGQSGASPAGAAKSSSPPPAPETSVKAESNPAPQQTGSPAKETGGSEKKAAG